MKTWLVVIFVFGIAGGARAQEAPAARENDGSSAATLPGTSWAMAASSSLNYSNVNDFFVAPALRLSFTEPASSEFAARNSAMPMASPVPKRHTASHVDNYRL